MNNMDPALKNVLDSDPIMASAEKVGLRLVETLINELTLIPHPTVKNQSVWSAMPENMQADVLDRMQRRIRNEIELGYEQIFRHETPAVRAELAKVTFQAGKVQGTLEIPTTSKHRHELSDFAGRHVIVVLPADLEEYFEDMADIVAEADQAELDLNDPDENYDADGPGDLSAEERRAAGLPDPDCKTCAGTGEVKASNRDGTFVIEPCPVCMS